MQNLAWPYDLIAEIYDIDMGQNMTFNDTKAYLRLLGRVPGRMIEAGAGTGRLTIPFLQAGWEVLAIERSAPMLKQLVVKQGTLPERSQLHCVLADAGRMPLLASKSFDAVVLPYSMICYLTEVDATLKLLRTAHGLLVDNGILIVDVFIPKDVLAQSTKFTQDYCRSTEKGTVTRYKRMTTNAQSGINFIERQYHIKCGNNNQIIETQSSVRPIQPHQLCKIICRAEFDIIEQFFDYGINTIAEESQYFTVAAHKH